MGYHTYSLILLRAFSTWSGFPRTLEAMDLSLTSTMELGQWKRLLPATEFPLTAGQRICEFALKFKPYGRRSWLGPLSLIQRVPPGRGNGTPGERVHVECPPHLPAASEMAAKGGTLLVHESNCSRGPTITIPRTQKSVHRLQESTLNCFLLWKEEKRSMGEDSMKL